VVPRIETVYLKPFSCTKLTALHLLIKDQLLQLRFLCKEVKVVRKDNKCVRFVANIHIVFLYHEVVVAGHVCCRVEVIIPILPDFIAALKRNHCQSYIAK